MALEDVYSGSTGSTVFRLGGPKAASADLAEARRQAHRAEAGHGFYCEVPGRGAVGFSSISSRLVIISSSETVAV